MFLVAAGPLYENVWTNPFVRLPSDRLEIPAVAGYGERVLTRWCICAWSERGDNCKSVGAE